MRFGIDFGGELEFKLQQAVLHYSLRLLENYASLLRHYKPGGIGICASGDSGEPRCRLISRRLASADLLILLHGDVDDQTAGRAEIFSL